MISICKGGRWREDERRLGDPLGSVTVVSTSFSTNLAPCTTTPWNRKHVGITMRRERRSARGLKYFLIRGIGRSFNLIKSRRRVSSAPPSSTLISCRRSGAFHVATDVATECSARNTGGLRRQLEKEFGCTRKVVRFRAAARCRRSQFTNRNLN